MKNEQHQSARELYFNTNLSKTEIAERLNVSRRTIYQWTVDGDWDKLRNSARHMPAILAEKVHYLIGHFTDQLLSADSCDIAISKTDVNMLHKLTITAAKLKKGSTVADNMETFTYFLERIQRSDPALAEVVAPHVADYIRARRGKDERSFLLSGFDEEGFLPYSEKEQEEILRDKEDAAAIQAEQEPRATPQPSAAKQQPKPATPLPTRPVQFVSNAIPQEPIQTYTSSKPRPVHMPAYDHASSRKVQVPAEAA